MKRKKLNVNLIIGLALILVVSTTVVICFFAPPYVANEMNYGELLQRPSLRHLFGTDNFGRDIFSRVMTGATVTFGVSLATVAIGAVIGTVVGALTGFYGGIVDEVLMRVNDCLASFPGMLIALVTVSVLGSGTAGVCIALGIVFIPSFARIMRGEFIAERERDYVLTARLLGASDMRIIFLNILPNTYKILLSSVLVGLNNAVLAEAGLSYLGLGIQPPDPSLGRMLAEAQVYIFGAPWYVISVSAVMTAALLGLSLVSENIGVSGISLSAVKRKAAAMRRAERAGETDAQPGGIATRSGETDAQPGGIATRAERTDEREAETSAETDARKPEARGQVEQAEAAGSSAVIRIDKLDVSYIEEDGFDETLRDVCIELREHEILGIVGESGSGKSLTALSVMGILPERAFITGGSIKYRGTELTELSKEEYSKIRGRKLAMIFQEPMTSLNPLQTVGDQLDEVLDLHMSELTAGEQRQRVIAAMEDVGLDGAHGIYDMYPHELSGGMRQRVMIAMALIAGAEVIIADEPTTALDADVTSVIIDLFKSINIKYGTSIMLITHDMRIVAAACDRALVMKDGSVLEELCPERETGGFESPVTEYGKQLVAAAFATKSYVESKMAASRLATSQLAAPRLAASLRGVSVSYRQRGGLPGRRRFRKVIDNVSLDIRRGETLGLVGASGCGKSTLVRAIAGLAGYTTGSIELFCGRPGMVFQDPGSSLNPAWRVSRILEEPLKLRTGMTRSEQKAAVIDILSAVNLDPEVLTRRITQLSGGQKQRVAIACNLLLKPDMIILDEPLSALDVTLQEQVLELLMKLKERYDLTYILISHDRKLVSRVCDRVITVEGGHLLVGGEESNAV